MKHSFMWIVGIIILGVIAIALSIDVLFPTKDPEITAFNFSMQGKLEFDDATRGTNPESELVYAYFIDFTCPFCTQKHPTFIKLMQEHPEVNFLAKHLVDYSNERSQFAAVAFECVKDENLEWDLADYLFSEQFTAETIHDYVRSLGVNYDNFMSCIHNENIYDLIEADAIHGSYLGVRGTPTVFLNGIKIEGYHSFEVYSQFIKREWKDIHGE